MIPILMVFTYSRSDSKIKLIMPENNTNNLNKKTQLNKISVVIHNVMTKFHYYNINT
jgi:hypothetical protein